MLLPLILLPLVGALLIAITNIKAKIIATIFSLITLAYSIIIYIKIDNIIIESLFNTNLMIDGISLPFILLTAVLFPICLLVPMNKNIKLYLILFLLLESTLMALFMLCDLFLFYIAFETSLIPIYLLLAFWGSRERRKLAGYKLFIYTLFASLFFLIALLVIYNGLGTTDYFELLNYKNQGIEWLQNKGIWLTTALLFAFAVKVPVFPFHLWLPEAHSEAPTAASMILAGILLKMGSYGMIRFNLTLFPEQTFKLMPIIQLLLLLSVIYATLTTLRQVDLKRIIAYSSIAHLNLSLFGLFSNNLIGITGSIFLQIAHGIVSAALFFIVGCLYDRYHTRALPYYSGIVNIMPVLSTIFFIFILANMAVPLSGNFIGELLVLYSTFLYNIPLMLIVSLSIIGGAFYNLWLFNRVIMGKISNYMIKFKQLSRQEFYLLSPLLFLNFFLGFIPNWLFNIIQPAVMLLLR